MAEEARGHLSLAEVGTEEFLQKLTSQITEMVSAKITQGEGQRGRRVPWRLAGWQAVGESLPGASQPLCPPSQAAGAWR